LSIHPFADLAVFPRYQIILIQRLNLILIGLGAATAAAFGKLPDLGCALASQQSREQIGFKASSFLYPQLQKIPFPLNGNQVWKTKSPLLSVP